MDIQNYRHSYPDIVNTFIFKKFFSMWPIFKICWICYNIACFMFGVFFFFFFFGHTSCGILAPQPGIEPIPPTLKGKVLTSGPPGRSPNTFILENKCSEAGDVRFLRPFRMLGLGGWCWDEQRCYRVLCAALPAPLHLENCFSLGVACSSFDFNLGCLASVLGEFGMELGVEG